MRVVLDTNILLSALMVRHTPPDRIYAAWLQNKFELATSEVQVGSRDRERLTRPASDPRRK